MKNRFSTVLLMSLNTGLTIIGATFGPVAALVPCAWFFFWFLIWRKEVREARIEADLENRLEEIPE